jgi:hypothetical protein
MNCATTFEKENKEVNRSNKKGTDQQEVDILKSKLAYANGFQIVRVRVEAGKTIPVSALTGL